MRISYYADGDTYMGWTNWNFQQKYLELLNWVRSGNTLKVKGWVIRDVETFTTWAHLNKK